jgi:DNA repair exonuclease SbcCD ATPase subunit
MIVFQTIRWKNFLSTGNSFTEIDLKSNPSTLIVGSNGAGKSTMLDAICFALFNKPFRKINKPQLVNAINEKDCVVEVEFKVGSTEWKIIRGQKPNLFEIHRNGVPLNQEASAKDQQTWLEQSVLKLNYKSFTQVVILGSSTFVPFMQLTPAHRREVIEDLLDIRIFSSMNTILKDRVRSLKDSIRDKDYQFELAKERVEIQQRFIADLKEQSHQSNVQRQSQITDLRNEIEDMTKKISSWSASVEELNEKAVPFDKCEEQLKELSTYRTRFTDKNKKLNSDHKFFDKNDSCPTCKQSITEELRTEKKETILSQLLELEKANTDLEAKISVINGQLTEKNAILKEIAVINQEITSKNKEISWKQSAIKKIEDSIEKTDGGGENVKREQDKLKQLINDGLDVEKDISVKKKELANHEVVVSLLKDTGIKSQIIKKYLPVMNQLINRYLKELDFYVSFELNENFEETIKSRYRDDFSYASFSEGEKMRIDLALLFTWRMIAKMKNSACTNLLCLDEIFDSSLDNAGTDDFIKILKSFTDNSNVFVISHKPDILQDKFSRVLRVEKKLNFSTVIEDQ